MAALFRFKGKVFRYLLPPSQQIYFPLHWNDRLRVGLSNLPKQENSTSESRNPLNNQTQHKHRKIKHASVIDVLKGGTSLNNVKNPVAMLHECFVHVDNYHGGNNLQYKMEQKDKMFCSVLTLRWPTEQVFYGVGPNKKGAMRDAAVKALTSLWRSRNIALSGQPILVKNRKQIPSNQATVVLSPEDRQSLTELQNHFEEVKPHFELAKKTTSTDFGATESINDTIDIVYNIPRNHPVLLSNKKRYNRSLSLKEKLQRPRKRVSLPIDEHKDILIEAIGKHRVVLLRAETGSGKSSRYPQFIFDHYASLGKGVDCNIIVTQPRRLTAMSLARHVAKERNEDLGDVVGYSVRLDYVIPRPPGGSILYCTAGKLLQSLMLNPKLEGVSHICLDEVHERHYDCDLIMCLVRRVLRHNPNLHVTLMSATLNPEEFKNYFGSDCFVFDAPGRAYPVETHFLEELPSNLLQKPEERTEYTMMARITRWIDQKPPGGILMFLPGWKEIQGVNNILQHDERFHVVLLHSNIPLGDQFKVHDEPPLGKRKVVLATNIAESSITIADIVYVVDFPYERIGRYSYEYNELEHTLVSCPKSRLLQREGRAGRTQPGHCYHLLSKEDFDQLPEAPVPVLLRMSLDYPILVSKAMITTESVKSFFSDLLTPPPLETVENGIKSLEELGALDSEENITPLGKRLLFFGVEPRQAKALVLSGVFRCENTVAAYCAAAEFFPFNIFSSFPNTLKSSDVHPNSDHMVMINLFHLWLEMRDQLHAWKKLAESSRITLSYGECAMTYRFMLNLLDRLHTSKMLLAASPDALESGELQKEEFLKGILLNVHQSLGLAKRSHFRGTIPVNKLKFSTLSGKLMILSRESVFYKKDAEITSPYIFHYPSVDTGAVVTSRCTSLMSPLNVLLFMPGVAEVKRSDNHVDDAGKNVVSFNKLINIELDESDCESLLKLREAVWECVDYFVCKEGTSEQYTVGYNEIQDFREHLIKVLGEVLNGHAPGSKKSTESDAKTSKVADLFLEDDDWR